MYLSWRHGRTASWPSCLSRLKNHKKKKKKKSLDYCSDVSITVSVITTVFEVFRLFQFVNKIRCTENYLELHETIRTSMKTLLIKD